MKPKPSSPGVSITLWVLVVLVGVQSAGDVEKALFTVSLAGLAWLSTWLWWREVLRWLER